MKQLKMNMDETPIESCPQPEQLRTPQLPPPWINPEKAVPETRTAKSTTAHGTPAVHTRQFQPNDEQQMIMEAVKSGSPVVVVNAFAGTGKTATLELVAGAMKKKANYIVFNRKNADEARKRLPACVNVTTAHALAYRGLHPDFGNPMFAFYNRLLPTYRLVREYLSNRYVPSEDIFAVAATLRNYCQSCDERPEPAHVPPPIRAGNHRRGQSVDWYVETTRNIFESVRRTKGAGSHDLYLKLYSLKAPELKGDLLFIDEAQDINPCMLNIIETQMRYGKQVVLVGDRYQHIYGFNGAINAMAAIAGKYTVTECALVGSYRFGEQIARVANVILGYMNCPRQIRGLSPCPGSVRDDLERPKSGQTIIYRKNISMLHDILNLATKVPIQVVGGVQELRHLLQSAFALYQGSTPDHPEIGMFQNWLELSEFAGTETGRYLWPVVKYIEEHQQIDGALAAFSRIEETSRRNCPPETILTMTTAHKSKGLEFRSVQLHSDLGEALEEDGQQILRGPDAIDEEISLLYVAATRAREELNLGGIGRLLKPDWVEKSQTRNVTHNQTGEKWKMENVKWRM